MSGLYKVIERSHKIEDTYECPVIIQGDVIQFLNYYNVKSQGVDKIVAGSIMGNLFVIEPWDFGGFTFSGIGQIHQGGQKITMYHKVHRGMEMELNYTVMEKIREYF